MALMLEITKADGSVARTPLESQATKVGAWPGGKVRVIDTATGKAPANLTAKRVGDSLIVENLPDGKTVEITKFYTDCSPAAPCALVIDPANATEAVTITQTTPPIATLGENQALMYGPTSSSGAAAAAPAGGGLSTGAVLAGLALVGVAAAAGGGGGGGSKTPADTTPPDAPVVNTVAGDGVVDADEAAAGVAVSGTAEAGSTVTVTWGSTVKTATADAGGNWSVNFAQAELPADGPSTISVTARDAAGNVSSATEQAVTIDTAGPDTTPPDAPVVNTVAGDGVVDAGEAAAGVAVSGTAEAGSTVTVTWGSTVKTATADAGGNWSVNFAQAELPADGPSTVSVTARDAAGNVSSATEQTVTIDTGTPDTTAPDAPVIGAVAGDDVVNNAEATAGVPVSGTAEAGSTVNVTWGSTTKTATADSEGSWTVNFAAGELPADGAATSISATATDAAGNTSAPGTRPVDIDTAVPALTVNVAPDGVVSGTAEPGSTVTMGVQTTTADADTGEFLFTTALASGASASVVATDAAGNATASDVTAVTRQAGADGDDLILAGTTGFVDGGDGNDVLVGGDGGSVRNYQFEYWNATGADPILFNNPGIGAFTFGPDASNGWTMSGVVDSLGSRHTTGGLNAGMNIVRQNHDASHRDDTEGGGRYYFDTVRNETSGGSVISQEILTQAGESYTLSMQVSADASNTSMRVYWGDALLATYDGTSWSGDNEPIVTSIPGTSRQTLTWQVTGDPDPVTQGTTLEIRTYSTTDGSDDGWGIIIDRITLDAVNADTGETLVGGAGSDLLFGQGGDDTLYGGALGDTAQTADGVADAFVYSMRVDNGNDVIKDFEVGVDRIYLVDALDTDATGSRLPGETTDDPATTTTNADTNLSFADFMLGTSTSQYLVVADDGNGSVKLSFFGGSTDGATATELGSVVLEGVAYTGQTVQDLFTSNVLVATMDGFHTGLLTVV